MSLAAAGGPLACCLDTALGTRLSVRLWVRLSPGLFRPLPNGFERVLHQRALGGRVPVPQAPLAYL